MNSRPPRPGWCTWCRQPAADVALVHVIEQGSGPGGGVYACLAHARTLCAVPGPPAGLEKDVAEMARRAGESDPPG